MPGSDTTAKTTGDSPARSPRIAMIVDNEITGDSRVQKTAMSAADAGYDVVLVGRSASGRRDESTLGAAKVVKVPVPYTLAGYRRRNPGASWRWPLAYRTKDQVAHAKRMLDAHNLDYRAETAFTQERIAGIRARKANPLTTAVRTQAVLTANRARRLRLLRRRYWHGLRNREYKRAVAFAKAPHGLVERAVVEVTGRVRGNRFWRSAGAVFWDFEVAFGPVVDRLEPDVIYAHDFRMAGVAARAAARRRARGRSVQVIHDVHEYVPGVAFQTRRLKLANQTHEHEFIRRADVVVTVSDALADMLRTRHGLAEQPVVVLNAPHYDPLATQERATAPRLRERCGLAPDAPLAVYAGAAAPQRGLDTMIDALPQLPEVHVALVVATESAYVQSLVSRAAELGVADRLHVTGYVEPAEVVPFLASATIGAIPSLHYPNHEIALVTKYFEYMHARLPLVVADVRTMAAKTRELGNGEVFVAGDVDGYVAAVRAVLADRDRYVKVYDATPGLFEQYSWTRQAEVLNDVYARLTGVRPAGSLTAPGAPDGAGAVTPC